jgi:hypothetical protein
VSESEINSAIAAIQKIRKIHENASFHAGWGIFLRNFRFEFQNSVYSISSIWLKESSKLISAKSIRRKKIQKFMKIDHF